MHPLGWGQSWDLPAGASPTGQKGDNQAMGGRGVVWDIQDPMTWGSQQERITGGSCKGEKGSGLGEEGKWHVVGFRGCLPALSSVQDKYVPG